MGRRRRYFADRPANVEVSRKGTRSYFYYIFPDGRRGSLGTERAAAWEKAEALNAYFAGRHEHELPQPRPSRPSARNPHFAQLVGEFRMRNTHRRLTERTRQETEYRLRRLEREFGRMTVRALDTYAIARFADRLSGNAWVKYRKLLIDICQLATHHGYRPDNPAAATLPPMQQAKRRQRHTIDGFQRVRDHAPTWLQRAMELALYSLQRRDDIVRLHRDQVNLDAATLTILQRKTRHYANPVHLQIEMGAELFRAVEACMASDIPCPYLIHTRPKRITARARQAKAHPFAVTGSHLSRQFAAARDASGAYGHLPPEQRPTFHEIRALGMHLYESAGYSRQYIMALSGHATEAMYERYTRDHQQRQPKRVSADLPAIHPG